MDGPGVQDRQGGEMGGVIASRGYGIQLLETLRGVFAFDSVNRS